MSDHGGWFLRHQEHGRGFGWLPVKWGRTDAHGYIILLDFWYPLCDVNHIPCFPTKSSLNFLKNNLWSWIFFPFGNVAKYWLQLQGRLSADLQGHPREADTSRFHLALWSLYSFPSGSMCVSSLLYSISKEFRCLNYRMVPTLEPLSLLFKLSDFSFLIILIPLPLDI